MHQQNMHCNESGIGRMGTCLGGLDETQWCGDSVEKNENRFA